MASSFGKRFISTVGAGILGSALTLGVVANTDILQAKTQQEKTDSVTESSSTTPNFVQTSANSQTSLSDMVEYASKGIVGVSNFKNNGNRFAGSSELSEFGTGSGVIYKIDGEDAYIVTNNHVIEGAGKIEVTLHGGEKETAELIGSDALTDLAVLKINAQTCRYCT